MNISYIFYRAVTCFFFVFYMCPLFFFNKFIYQFLILMINFDLQYNNKTILSGLEEALPFLYNIYLLTEFFSTIIDNHKSSLSDIRPSRFQIYECIKQVTFSPLTIPLSVSFYFSLGGDVLSPFVIIDLIKVFGVVLSLKTRGQVKETLH